MTPWDVAVFGIFSAPEHFQKIMQKILARLKVLECQMADILVFRDTHEQRDQRLEAVLKSIEGNGLTLNIENANLPGRKSNPSGSSSVKMESRRISRRSKR